MSKIRREAGFTLIELMMVLAIIAIVVAFAVPAYQSYLIRARVIEGVTIATSTTSAVSEYRMTNGTYPINNDLAHIPAANAYNKGNVSSLTVTNGQVVVALNAAAVGLSGPGMIVLNPSFADGDGAVVWTCGTASAAPVPDVYLPANCRGHVF